MNQMLRNSRLPSHVLLMPDGDRRFARRNRIKHIEVYMKASRCVFRFVEIALGEFNITTVSVFLTRPDTFSRKIQCRGNTNLIAIFKAIGDLARNLRLHAKPCGFELSYYVLGQLYPPPLRIQKNHDLTASWDKMAVQLRKLANDSQKDIGDTEKVIRRINLLVNYSGSESLQKIIRNVASTQSTDQPSEEQLSSIMSSELGGPIGLVVRTGDGIRMSDGPCHLLYDSHFVHLKKLFPEINDDDIRGCLYPYFSHIPPPCSNVRYFNG